MWRFLLLEEALADSLLWEVMAVIAVRCELEIIITKVRVASIIFRAFVRTTDDTWDPVVIQHRYQPIYCPGHRDHSCLNWTPHLHNTSGNSSSHATVQHTHNQTFSARTHIVSLVVSSNWFLCWPSAYVISRVGLTIQEGLFSPVCCRIFFWLNKMSLWDTLIWEETEEDPCTLLPCNVWYLYWWYHISRVGHIAGWGEGRHRESLSPVHGGVLSPTTMICRPAALWCSQFAASWSILCPPVSTRLDPALRHGNITTVHPVNWICHQPRHHRSLSLSLSLSLSVSLSFCFSFSLFHTVWDVWQVEPVDPIYHTVRTMDELL